MRKMMTDKETVKRLIANDPDTVREFFFVRCRPVLAYIGRFFCRQRQSAEEMIGEFYEFISADNWHKLRIFRYSCSLNAYVTVIASRYFQRKRDAGRVEFDDSLMIPDISGICTSGTEYRSLMETVSQVINRMPAIDRILLNRILLDGEKPGDIIPEVSGYIDTDDMGTKTKEQIAGYVYTRYSRAKIRLQKALTELGYCG